MRAQVSRHQQQIAELEARMNSLRIWLGIWAIVTWGGMSYLFYHQTAPTAEPAAERQ